MPWKTALGNEIEYPAALHARIAKGNQPDRDDALLMIAEAKKIHDAAMLLNAKVVELAAECQRLKNDNEFLLAVQRESEGKSGWAGYERRTRDSIGGVLCYNTTGHAGACGQQIGSNGCGDFAVMLRGDRESAAIAAKLYLKQLQAQGHILVHAIFVPNGDQCDHSPVRVMSPEDLLKCVGLVKEPVGGESHEG